jgi:predicted DNA-binding transcriptional regulator AlpA
MTKQIPDSLRDFDSLPDAAYVRVATVARIFGCSVPSIWRMCKDSRLPAPRKLSHRVTGWNVGELRRTLSERGAA